MNKISWQSPSNIALVKYWGKHGNQLPMNPSISITLQEAVTTTSIMWHKREQGDGITIKLWFEGKENEAFEQRLNKFVNSITSHIPALKGLHLTIDSKNSFPHSSGIASSASAMSALALCLVSLEKELTGNIHGFDDFTTKASFIARLGSGSAARSVYGAYTQWGETENTINSSDDFAIDINANIHKNFLAYRDAILIVSDKTKKVSSTVGHGLMNMHPFAELKFKEAFKNSDKLLSILKGGNLEAFVDLVEAEALSLHAMMMTSTPSYLLMEAGTVAIIEKIRAFRQTTKIPICFTLDAGANVHVLYPEKDYNEVKPFIEQELLQHCANQQWLDDKIGTGPKRII